MKPVKYAFSILLLAAASITLSACALNVEAFKSPKENYKVTFEVIEDYKSKGSGDLDDISYIKYKISFFDKEGSYITEGEFTNVYGWSGEAQPTQVDEILDEFMWSPNEDFVILPEAEWASAPGSPDLKAINLNPDLNWKQAGIRMYIESWYGDLLLFGNVKDDCRFEVIIFDGKTGQSKPILDAESPLGYEIVDEQQGILYIRSILDNCRMPEDDEKFHHQCFEFDMAELQLTERPCS